MRDWFDAFWPLLALIGVVVLAGVGLGLAAHESPGEVAALYGAWCRANPQVQISQSDWELLRDKELLPGQVPSSSSGSASMAAGVAVGIAAGSAGRR